MYYKEAWINGKLCYKSTPNGEWIPFTIGQYKERVKQLEEQVKNLTLAAVSKSEDVEREALLLASFLDWLESVSENSVDREWIQDYFKYKSKQ